MKKIFLLLIMTVLAAVLAVNATAGSSLPAIIMLLLGKSTYNGPPLSHQAAMVGPLSGASVQAFQVDDLRTAQEGPIDAAESNSNLLSAGTFDLALTGVADSAWVVVEATGGKDIDGDGNGSVDTAPTANQGTLHALARASDWRSKHIRITPLTEIGWQYVENIIPAVSAEELEIRLADLARYLVKTDISGNGTIDWDDILAFDPANVAHRDKLAFDYNWLTTADDAGQTILASLRAGETDAMLAQLDETFSWLMTRFPVPDSRYHSVKIKLAVFGSGSATSGAPHNLSVNSTLAEPVYEDHIFLPEDASEQITFTAAPTAETQILSWTGCETVSADLSQCTVPLSKNQSVVVTFGWRETQLKAPVHDLSRAYNIVGASTVSVLLPDDMDDLIAEMAAANVDDFIVGDDGDGFLRRIIGINKISSVYYQLETAEATLDEVIAQGTGHLFKQMTNGDLEGYTAPASAAQQAMVAPTAFVGMEGASLKVSDQPDDTTFTITLGEQPSADVLGVEAAAQSFSGTVTLYDDGQGGTVSAQGEISLEVSVDSGVDYRLFSGLQGFKFIVKVDAEQSVKLSASAELAKVDFVRKKIGTFRFARIPVTGLPIPAWVTPTVDVFFFVEGKVEAQVSFGVSFSQNVEGGLLYNKDTGFSIHKSLIFDKKFIPPTASIAASMRGGIEVSPALKIYDFAGPALPQQVYSKIEGGVSVTTEGCVEVTLQNMIGYQADYKWDLSGSTKLGKFFHLDEFEERTTLFSVEWPYRKITFYESCPVYSEGAFLVVDGEGIFSTIDLADPSGLASTLTVANTGDEDLHWNTTNGSAAITISPSSGVLAPGAEEIVQMSVATADLPVGRYLRKPFFYNEASLGQDLPDEEFGNTRKTVDIIVNDTGVTDTPVITSAVSNEPGQVVLDWDFTPSGSYPLLGFAVYATETPADPDSYRSIYTTNSYGRQVVISGVTPGATYYFKMRVYGNNAPPFGPYSNVVSAQIAGNPPSFIPFALNDTGITWSGTYPPDRNNTTCVSNLPDGDNVFKAQDCSHGRDVTHHDDSDGHAGFSYTKLDSNGGALTDQNADYATTPWACVKDNVTGLIWEVKTDDGGLHDKDDTYTWYNTDPNSNGGGRGDANYSGTTCHGYNSSDSSTFCNTEAYVNRVNAAGWCGYSDWRMPTLHELESIVDYNRYSPSIDTDYFPDNNGSNHVWWLIWSGSPLSGFTSYKWSLAFSTGYSNIGYCDDSLAVRLVRDGE